MIKEKEQEAKTAEELRLFYEGQVAALQETIEKEGNELLLKRLREVHLQDVGKKLRELESIQEQLDAASRQEKTEEVRKVRERLEGILSSVSNPEEDDRLIKQFCYSLPVFGNVLYLAYMVGKKFDPSLQDRVHRRLNSFAGTGSSRSPLIRAATFLGIVIFIVGVVTIGVFIVQRVMDFL